MAEKVGRSIVGTDVLSRARPASIEVEMTACMEIAILKAKAVRETARVIQLLQAIVCQVLFLTSLSHKKLKKPGVARITMVPNASIAMEGNPSLFLICLN